MMEIAKYIRAACPPSCPRCGQDLDSEILANQAACYISDDIMFWLVWKRRMLDSRRKALVARLSGKRSIMEYNVLGAKINAIQEVISYVVEARHSG